MGAESATHIVVWGLLASSRIAVTPGLLPAYLPTLLYHLKYLCLQITPLMANL